MFLTNDHWLGVERASCGRSETIPSVSLVSSISKYIFVLRQVIICCLSCERSLTLHYLPTRQGIATDTWYTLTSLEHLWSFCQYNLACLSMSWLLSLWHCDLPLKFRDLDVVNICTFCSSFVGGGRRSISQAYNFASAEACFVLVVLLWGFFA